MWFLRLKSTFFESNDTLTGASSLSSMPLSRFAGFLGRMKAAVSSLGGSEEYFTNLWASVATNVIDAGSMLM